MSELDLFNAALKLTGDQRTAFLAAACGQDSALRKQVEELLQANDETGGLLPRHTNRDLAATQAQTTQSQPGTMIGGRFKLIEAIGEGGMGTVWLAEQREPVRRKVAVKLIKAGMDSKSVLARFEAERQALAMMDHPNIAKVFDGGVTDQGRPFFVMEYVKGVPLTEYCDQARLSLKERLNLFRPVCQAVQHAHQKGIIHRDLKPSNILICLYDGKPVPKVIDFGLAKAMHQSLTDQSLHTAHGVMVGTPLYMSPEQAEHNNLDVDTRTDIYSLGVILYELLTGSTPLERQQMKDAAYNEILRLIKDVEPPKPSTRLSSSLSLRSIAAQRSIEPNQLKRSVAGDLDWIVMKALDKERSRRYETANGLSRDVERFLNDEAVEACPPSTAYRLKKFIHRNRAMVTAISAVAAALVLGIIGFAWQANVATAQRDLADKARESEAESRQVASDERDKAVLAQQQEKEQRKLAEAARVEAENQKTKALEQEAEAKKQAAIAEAVAKFQTDMLAAVDPNQLPKDPVTKEPLKDAVTVLQAMTAAVKALDSGSLKDQPLVEAKVRNTIGTTLRSLARYDEAEPNLRKSSEIWRAALPAGHPDISTGLNNLAGLLQDQNKLAEAEPLYREALDIKRAALPAGHPDIARGLHNLASFLTAQNKLAEAEPLYREALEIFRAALPAGHPDIATGLNSLAELLRYQNKLAEAEPLYHEALKIVRAALPAGHPNIAIGLNNLALLLQAQNKLAEAEPLYREALEILRAAFHAGHPDIARGLNNLASLLKNQNKLAEAEPLYREALEIYRAARPAGHPDIARGLNNLALLLQAQNKLAEAEPLNREALEIKRAALPAGHPSIATGLDSLAGLLKAQNKLAEAEPLNREALEIFRATLPAGHPDIARGLNNLALLLQDQNKLAEAEPLLREALEIFRAALPASHPKIAQCLYNLAGLLQAQNKLSEAEPLYREALDIYRAGLPAGHPKIAQCLNNLAGMLKDQNKLAEAEPLFREALEIARKALPAGHPDIAMGLNNLAVLLKDQNKLAEAEPLLRESLEIARKALPADHPNMLISIGHMGSLLRAQNRHQEAIDLLAPIEAATRKAFTGSAARRLAALLTTLERARIGLGYDAERVKLAEANLLEAHRIFVQTRGETHKETLECIEGLVELYTAWAAAEPDKGHDTKAAEWQTKLNENQAATATPSDTAKLELGK